MHDSFLPDVKNDSEVKLAFIRTVLRTGALHLSFINLNNSSGKWLVHQNAALRLWRTRSLAARKHVVAVIKKLHRSSQRLRDWQLSVTS